MTRFKGWIRAHPWWTGLIVLALLAILYLAFGRGGPPAPDFETGEVTRGDVSRTIAASGKVRARRTVEVGAEVSG
ncbi:MAG: hypothetical protein WA979_13490, partial [Pacificimonas sp.]